MAGSRKGTPTAILELIAELGRLCGSAGARWALGGGHAANRYRSQVRATIDIALHLDAEPEIRDRIEDDLASDGWEVRRFSADGSIQSAIRGGRERLDLLYSETDLEREAVERAQSNMESEVPVLDGECLIVFKLIADRPRDNDDVISILLAHPEWSESDWIREQAKQWDREGQWNELRVAANDKRRVAGLAHMDPTGEGSPSEDDLPDPP